MVISPDNFLYDADGIYEWTPAKAKSSWNRQGAATFLPSLANILRRRWHEGVRNNA